MNVVLIYNLKRYYPGFGPWAFMLRPLGALTKSSRGVSPLFLYPMVLNISLGHMHLGNAELQLGYGYRVVWPSWSSAFPDLNKVTSPIQ